jgi:hypothetical protein
MGHWEEGRMTYVQREKLQMLVSFLSPFREGSLLLEADAYATLPLVQLSGLSARFGIRFS